MKKILFLLLIQNASIILAQINPQNIKIARDSWGVPHIYGKTDAEAAYGLAWAHSEDDFKTIQISLLAGKQMLGRHLGKEGAAADYIVGLIRAKELANEHYSDFSPEFKSVHAGYVAGLNAYAAKHPNEVFVKGSFPITVQESLAGTILSISVFTGLDAVVKQIFANKMPLANWKGEGSNAWAMNSKITTDGNVYLNLNSHQPFEGPQSWYEAHVMSDEGWNCLGGLFPGGTSLFLGVNETLGWTHTVNYHDKMDVFQLELNPANKNQYKFDNEWLTLEERTLKLPVKVGPATIKVKKKAWWSKYGPTVVTKEGNAFAIRFAMLFEVRAIEQWFKMNKAKNFTEFKKAMEMTAIPGFNTIYADKQDTIFYVSNGKIPLRNPQYDWQKTLPGNTSATLWTGFHPFSDLPQILNPKAGYVFNTNNTPYSATAPAENLDIKNFDKTMGIETWENNRSNRFKELISTYNKVSYDDFKKIKYDHNLPAKLSYFTNIDSMYFIKKELHPDIAEQINLIQTWDKKGDLDSKGAVVLVLMYEYFKGQNLILGNRRTASLAECVDAIDFAKKYMLKHFKTTNLTLTDIQKHGRGTLELPMAGLPDVLAAFYTKPAKNGKLYGYTGDSYISLVKFAKEGLPQIETVVPYGASSHADSPHYTDQLPLFATQKLKKMTLDRNQVMKDAVKVYSPE